MKTKNQQAKKPVKVVPRKLSEDERQAKHAETRARKARQHEKKYAPKPSNGYESKGAEKKARQIAEQEARKLRIDDKKAAAKLEQEVADQFGPPPYGKEHHQLRSGHVVFDTGKMHYPHLVQAVRDRWEQDEWLFVVPKGWTDTLPHLYEVITGEEYVAPKAVKRFAVVNKTPATIPPRAKGARLDWEL